MATLRYATISGSVAMRFDELLFTLVETEFRGSTELYANQALGSDALATEVSINVYRLKSPST